MIRYLEMLSNDGSNPCYFVDYDTEELVFVNQAMEKKFQIFEDYSGRNYKEVLAKFIDLKDFCKKEELTTAGFIEKLSYNELLQAYQRLNTTLVPLFGRMLIMTKCFLTSSDDALLKKEDSFENAITQSLELLQLPELTQSIQGFLGVLGEFYDCSHAYIYEIDEAQASFTKKYYWYANGESKRIETKINTVSMEEYAEWLRTSQISDMVHLDKEVTDYDVDTIEYALLEKYALQNISLSKLWNKDGSLRGVVGLSNRKKPIHDDRLLRAISHFVVERFNEQSLVRALETLNDMDLLTGFYNRAKYAEKLVELQQEQPHSLGVIFVNLNGLRKTNEYLGFEVGDVQLKKTAVLLREFFKEDFYRISGDEFVGFVPNCEKDIFEERVGMLQGKLKDKNHESTFSLGHSWESGSFIVTTLVKNADTMMVINKQAYYFNSLKNTEEITNTILKDLFRAIAEEEFLVYLQPQINLETKEVVGAEALIRRFDKKHNKMVYPDLFIPLYEKNSVIRHVDLFVIRKVCQILIEWQKQEQELQISVNLSRVTLMEHGIVKTISDILDEYGVPHHLIVIEITERIGVIENEVATTLVDEFKGAGFKLSLDDFGCAYSNIVTLSQIDVDEVKIDKSLVDNLISNPKNRIIVKNMLLMCSEFENTFTLAEGIETEEQADFLRSVHCHLGQGYLYSRPIPNEEFYEKYIKNPA